MSLIFELRCFLEICGATIYCFALWQCGTKKIWLFLQCVAILHYFIVKINDEIIEHLIQIVNVSNRFVPERNWLFWRNCLKNCVWQKLQMNVLSSILNELKDIQYEFMNLRI